MAPSSPSTGRPRPPSSATGGPRRASSGGGRCSGGGGGWLAAALLLCLAAAAMLVLRQGGGLQPIHSRPVLQADQVASGQKLEASNRAERAAGLKSTAHAVTTPPPRLLEQQLDPPDPQGSAPQQASIAEIGPTVYVGGVQDLRPDANGSSKCSALVDAAAAYGAFSRVSFLVSVLWWDSGPADPPPGWDGCTKYTLSTYYCFSRFNATTVQHFSYHLDQETQTALPVNETQAEEFRDLLGTCLQHAVKSGLDIAINVHLDDGRQDNGWRNTLAFDPLEPYGGFTYYEAVLEPIVDALSATMALRPESQAWLALQGEMGATVFFYPQSWAEVADMVRARAGLGARLHLGLGINNSKLCGCVLIDIVDYNEYLAAFAPLWPSIEGWFDLPAIRAAFEAVDFIGISAYVPQKRLDFEPCDMEGLMQMMDKEFGYYNLTLRELVFDMGKQIHWIEWGIGGGVSQNGDKPATTALEAAHYPFWGVYGPWNASRDPWLTPPVRDYMHYYVNQTSEYLLQGGCEYQVASVYLWTVGGSWNVIGLGTDPRAWGWHDDVATGIIQQHNQRARELSGKPKLSALQAPMPLAEPAPAQPPAVVPPKPLRVATERAGSVELLPPAHGAPPAPAAPQAGR